MNWESHNSPHYNVCNTNCRVESFFTLETHARRVPVSRVSRVAVVARGDWGDPRLKSSALQAQMLKSLKSMPGHTFKAPDTNILKSDKSLRAAGEGDGCLA